MDKTDIILQYAPAVNAIKSAILQGQYEAAKGVTRIQLAVYFAIGKYISEHTRTKAWGSHALEVISEQLQKELPGLCGYSETQMKDMRRFYEAWSFLDSTNSAVATAELLTTVSESVAVSEEIDIYHAITMPDIEFPIEEFFKVPFTHHSKIISGAKRLADRYYYIHRVAEEHLPVKKLSLLIADGAHKHQGQIPNNFTRTINDPREARKAVMMFKDDYMLNFINVEQIEEREQSMPFVITRSQWV